MKEELKVTLPDFTAWAMNIIYDEKSGPPSERIKEALKQAFNQGESHGIFKGYNAGYNKGMNEGFLKGQDSAEILRNLSNIVQGK